MISTSLERRAAGVAIQQVRQRVAGACLASIGTICWWPMLLVLIDARVAARTESCSTATRSSSPGPRARRLGDDEQRRDRAARPAHGVRRRHEVQAERQRDGEPDSRRRLQVRQRREGGDAGEAAGDVDRVGRHAVAARVERPAHRLPEADEHQRDEHEERRRRPPRSGTTNRETSCARYSVPKKICCGDPWPPTSIITWPNRAVDVQHAARQRDGDEQQRHHGRRSGCGGRAAARQPTDIPRNVASSTMLVKNVRKTTVLANQRMQASSRNRIRKLTRNRSRGLSPNICRCKFHLWSTASVW